MSDPLGGLDPTGPGGPIQEGRFGGLGRLFRRRRSEGPVLGSPEPSASNAPTTSPGQDLPTSRPVASARPDPVSATRQRPTTTRPGRDWGGGGMLVAAVVALAVVGGIVPAVLGFVLDDSTSGFGTVDVPDITVPDITIPDITVPATTVATPGADLFADATPAFDGWRAELGDQLTARQIVLYPDYAFLEAGSVDSLDRYQFRDGEVGDADEPTTSPADDLTRELFAFDAVDPAIVTRLIRRAPRDTGNPTADVSHVIVESDLPFADEVVIRVYVGNGRIDATLDGRIQEVFPSTA